MVEVRLASSDADLSSVRGLFREYARAFSGDPGFVTCVDTQRFDAEVDTLPGPYGPPSGVLLLASIDGGAPVGCVACRTLEPGVGEMKRLFVLPAGRGHGVGERLVTEVLGAARALGFRRVRLDTLPSMATAQALYERIGFHDIPPYGHHPAPGTRYMEVTLEIMPGAY